MRSRLALLLLLILAPPALASDGVLEINQTCATTSGCFSGDTAGFPVSIDGSAGRSYRLTSDLVVPDAATTGISVGTSYVSIDLGGFSIRGPVTCSGNPLVCTATSGGDGVRDLSNRGTEVSNGSVIGMGGTGIHLATEDVVHDVRVAQNGLNGIFIGIQSRVFRCTARQNQIDGIAMGIGSSAIENVSNGNGRNGIFVSSGVVADNAVAGNGSDGIIAATGNVHGNTSESNGDDGIDVSSDAQVSGNSTHANVSDGIEADSHSFVFGNNASDNAGNGLLLGDDSAYRENLIASNTSGTVAINGTGTFINSGNNACTDASNVTVACP